MKNKMKLLLCAGIILSPGFSVLQEVKNDLPFTINYSLPLKVQAQQHLEKYDYTEYTAGEDVMQLKHYVNMTKEKGKKMMEDRKFFLSSLFKDQPSPYPGVLSGTIGCPDELVPKPKEDTIVARLDYKLLATRNLIYGNCNINDNYYYCLYSIFFCPIKKELYELKIFTPIKTPSFNYETITSTIKCKE